MKCFLGLGIVALSIGLAPISHAQDIDISQVNDFKESALSASLGGSYGSVVSVIQEGESNFALAQQSGELNQLSILQIGHFNQAISIQSGDFNQINIEQYGDGNLADIRQYGSFNQANVVQYGHQSFVVEQHGDFSVVNITQF